MSRFAEGTIAAVSLVDTNSLPLRIDVLDGEQLKGTAIASHVTALDHTVHTQVMATTLSGIHFGCKFYQMPIALLESVLEAMETAMLAGDSFEVSLSDDDGIDTIAVMAVIDYAALGGKAYTRGGFSGVYVRDVTMRFIATGAAEEGEGMMGAFSAPPPEPPDPFLLAQDLDLQGHSLIGELDENGLSIDGGLI